MLTPQEVVGVADGWRPAASDFFPKAGMLDSSHFFLSKHSSVYKWRVVGVGMLRMSSKMEDIIEIMQELVTPNGHGNVHIFFLEH